MDLVSVDIGGTHARFALANIAPSGSITLDAVLTLPTSHFAGLQTAWEAYERHCGGTLPRNAAVGIAGPVTGDLVRMSNNDWVLNTGTMDRELDLERVTVLNDFAALAHAVACGGEDQFSHITGPEGPLPQQGTITVIGPGTGLGVAYLHRHAGGYQVQATEGGHAEFAPIDAIEDWMQASLRRQHLRVSTERIHSGPGICHFYRALAELEDRPTLLQSDRDIWEQGLARSDSLAAAAVERFCQSLGSVAGDFALAHGASAVVLAGGVGLRLRDHLPRSGFGERFRFKGRYAQLMAGIPVKLIVHKQPGLFGAAVAFRRQHLA